jgi:hypothetical protein
MQTAAEDARTRTLSQFQADAKAHVEHIHGRSSSEAAALRRAADDDVAAVREWSKAEIARIREETETRITDRKARLETEIESHAGVIEREIARVQAAVTIFEEEMAAFFERLLGEEDPTRFATMAENLPEPPPFASILPSMADDLPSVEAVEAAEAVVVVDVDVAEESATETALDESTEDQAESLAEVVDVADEPMSEDQPVGSVDETDQVDLPEVDREAAFAAIQAAAEAAASAEVASDAAARAEAVAEVFEIVGGREEDDEGESDESEGGEVVALDFDAAEAESFAATDEAELEEIPTIDDDALATRLAGLVPGKADDDAASGNVQTTQVVVVGLVSVASIASFKRHLGRLAGVRSVGVSSGPDGEFVFAVSHGDDVALREVIPSIPGFQSRVTGSGEGSVQVTAHDPESDN